VVTILSGPIAQFELVQTDRANLGAYLGLT
jgi:hypothetical protein